MIPKEVRSHVFHTYTSLRAGLGVIALAFPLILLLGGMYGDAARVPLQGSFSAYYHTHMRNYFVGILFALGSFLYLYKGFSWKENVALNAAGVLAVLVAVVPMDPPPPVGTPAASRSVADVLHSTFAALFLLAIAYVCVFRSADTLPLMPRGGRRRTFYLLYKLIGAMMVATPVVVAALALRFKRDPSKGEPIVTFFVEVAAVVSFGLYWMLKTKEIADSLADRIVAVRGAAGLRTQLAVAADAPRIPVA